MNWQNLSSDFSETELGDSDGRSTLESTDHSFWSATESVSTLSFDSCLYDRYL